jgi:hypothetical protein
MWTNSPLEAAIHVYDSAERHIFVEVLASDLPRPMSEADSMLMAVRRHQVDIAPICGTQRGAHF